MTENPSLVEYWFETSSHCDRIIEFTAFMRKWAAEVAAEGDTNDLSGIVREFRHRTRRLPQQPARHDPQSSTKQLVDDDDERFRGAMELLQQELKPRLATFSRDGERSQIENLLNVSTSDLADEFGSFSAAWDFLVELKYHTSVPDSRQLRRNAWFSVLIEHSERFIRDIISVAVLFLGRSVLRDELMACLHDADLAVYPATPRQLARLNTTAEVLADTVTGYMDRDNKNTTSFARTFGGALGAPLFDPHLTALEQGLLSGLVHGDTMDAAWALLLDVRHAIVHTTVDELHDGEPVDLDRLLYNLDKRRMELLAELLGAFCFGFAIRMMVRVAEKAEADDRELVERLRRLLSGELRVLLKRILNQERYAFAWAVAEVAIAAEPADSPGTMLRLNAYFARQQLKPGEVPRDEIARIPVGNLPRHRIIRQVLLRDFNREELEPLLDEALSSGDVAMHELRQWPALGDLWLVPWVDSWLLRYDERP
ncbi:hypothetical protein SAMN05421812_11626 [Asanoa hainanensis]|uniref:Uncharacterized protein n=1 Tax=Asanoa hainanensis TaxID=560556 RepID=A0A239PAH9_9ACTN|nr:hypothetical protein [Asanoa hainanensis]SNT63912.1 hypothetical protein SAMN05421812_11626 [Asanoa hainanensis]